MSLAPVDDQSIPATVATVEIEVCQRLLDRWRGPDGRCRPKQHAQVKGEPGLWACGRTVNEAIGELVRAHPERFGIVVSYLEGHFAR